MLSPNRSRAENRLTHVAPLRTRDENTRSHSPPYFARGKAPTAVSHHCFGCLRLHSARASCREHALEQHGNCAVATSLHSGKAKINYLTLRVVEMRDGDSWCKYALRPALFLASPPG